MTSTNDPQSAPPPGRRPARAYWTGWLRKLRNVVPPDYIPCTFRGERMLDAHNAFLKNVIDYILILRKELGLPDLGFRTVQIYCWSQELNKKMLHRIHVILWETPTHSRGIHAGYDPESVYRAAYKFILALKADVMTYTECELGRASETDDDSDSEDQEECREQDDTPRISVKQEEDVPKL